MDTIIGMHRGIVIYPLAMENYHFEWTTRTKCLAGIFARGKPMEDRQWLNSLEFWIVMLKHLHKFVCREILQNYNDIRYYTII